MSQMCDVCEYCGGQLATPTVLLLVEIEHAHSSIISWNWTLPQFYY